MLKGLLRTASRPQQPCTARIDTRPFSILKKAARRKAEALKQEQKYIEQRLAAQLEAREARHRVLKRIHAVSKLEKPKSKTP